MAVVVCTEKALAVRNLISHGATGGHFDEYHRDFLLEDANYHKGFGFNARIGGEPVDVSNFPELAVLFPAGTTTRG